MDSLQMQVGWNFIERETLILKDKQTKEVVKGDAPKVHFL